MTTDKKLMLTAGAMLVTMGIAWGAQTTVTTAQAKDISELETTVQLITTNQNTLITNVALNTQALERLEKQGEKRDLRDEKRDLLLERIFRKLEE